MFRYNKLYLSFLFLTVIQFNYAQKLEIDHQDDFLSEPIHEKAIIEQDDFFERYRPLDILKSNTTQKEDIRINSAMDVSNFSNELVQFSGIDKLSSGKRYHKKKKVLDFSRLMPSNSGPTGLFNVISARGLPEGKISGAYINTKTEIKQTNLFKNTNSFNANDANFLINYGYSDNFELNLKVMKTSRTITTSANNKYNSSIAGFPELTIGIKAHQKYKSNEFAIGFLNTNIASQSRKMIIDQDFENFKTLYLSMTSNFTYRTESHFVLKRSSTDKKFNTNNTWMTFLAGFDTKLSKKTHFLAEIKYEDYESNVRDLSVNGGIRHVMNNSAIDLFIIRGNQIGYSETGFKISGAF
ncbi:MAG: hypothetical protein COB02_14005 [Candidatus Cloacimonadota bacterium]|nr:MAG: hypothetical protein COB02_14005 [Candidatus Cloacimonadota bacterium]